MIAHTKEKIPDMVSYIYAKLFVLASFVNVAPQRKNMMVIAKLVVLAMVAMRCQADLGLGNCNLQCDGDDGLSTSSHSGLPARLQGAPGKKGPIGLKGMKGDPGEKCECLNVRNLVQEINQVKANLYPSTCADLVTNKHRVDASGVYTIYPFPEDTDGVQVYCDLLTDGGGWLVFQKRIDGSENFFRNFSDYTRGFGKLHGEFWLGLDLIHDLTKNNEYELRVDMEDFENETRYASYGIFSVGEGSDYSIRTGDYSGTAGDSMPNSARFSARDLDQDTSPSSCSELYSGGFWYASCHSANPNGLYLRGHHTSYADGINWRAWRGYNYSLKRMEMKIRKK